VLWEDSPPATWEKALGVLASKLRAVLGESGELTAAFGCYRLDLAEGSWIDVVAAEDAADEAEAALGRNDLEAARRAAALVESLIRGPFLPGDDGTWVEQKRRELAGVRARALSALAEACLGAGETQDSVRWAAQAIDAEPFRESGYRLLMEAHIAGGNRAEALRVYERCRHLLAEELGAFPSPETEAVYRDLLAAPVAGTPDVAPAAVSMEPIRGGATRRQKTAAGLVLLLVAGVSGAIIAVESGGGPPPKVAPDSVIRIDPRTLRVKQVVPLPSTQPDLVVAAGRYVWVTTHVLRDTGSDDPRYAGDRTLIRVDPSNGETRTVGGILPCGLAADPSGDVWVTSCNADADESGDTVVRVDAKTLRFRTRVQVSRGFGYYQGLAYGGGSLWVGNLNGNAPNDPALIEIDPEAGKIVKTVRPGLQAGAMTFANGYGDVWMTNFSAGELTRYDVPTKQSTTISSGLLNPGSVVVDDATVWAGDWNSSRVARLHAVGAPRTRVISLPTHHPAGVWNLAAGAGFIWVASPRDRTLWRIDPDTNKVTPIHIGYLAAGVAADASDVWVTVRGP
jgi:SARP family transcriptional regulator, regulator of embCAB operon